MPVFRGGAVIDDAWVMLDGAAPVPREGAVVMPLARWRAERGGLQGRRDQVGVLIAPGELFEDVINDLVARPLIALAFPKYTDGRAYSIAQLLRTRHGYRGELRAIGDVLLDQLQLMARCGIDSFEIVHGPTIEALRRGHVAGLTHFYQPGVVAEKAPAGTRPWLRTGARA